MYRNGQNNIDLLTWFDIVMCLTTFAIINKNYIKILKKKLQVFFSKKVYKKNPYKFKSSLKKYINIHV